MKSTQATKSIQMVVAAAAVASLAGCAAGWSDHMPWSSTSASHHQSSGYAGQASGQQAAMSALPVSEDLVRSVQQQLQAKGVNSGPVDGVWGPATAQGVQRFQQSQGLQATGQLNAATLQALGVVNSENERSATGSSATTRTGAPDQSSFNRLDTNNDGLVSRSEAAADPRISRNFDQADQDRNGTLSRDEFNRAFETSNPTTSTTSGTNR